MKKLIIVVFSLCFSFAVFSQNSTKDFGFTGQFSINFTKYRYRIYDSHILIGFHYKNHHFLGGIIIPNEVGITRELSYENRIWPQNMQPSVLYYYKTNNWIIGAGFFGESVFSCSNISIITYNNEVVYNNRVFTEEIYLLGYKVFPINDQISWGLNFKFSFIKEYNFLKNETNDIQDNSIKTRMIPSLGVSLNFN